MNKKNIYATAAVFLLLVMGACNNVSGPESAQVLVFEGKAAVTVNIGAENIRARTVLPNTALSDVTGWKLWGEISPAPDTLLAEFSDPETQTVYLEPGTWDFTLNGYKDDDLILQGVVTDKTITLEGSNVLSFTVAPVSEGTGTIRITVNLPAGHGITEVKVFKDGDDLNEALTPSGDTVIFEKTAYAAGDYVFSLMLYKGDGLYGVVSELVQARMNLSSEKTYTLGIGDLNLRYLINYRLNSGQLSNGVENPGQYRHTDANVALPLPTRTGYAFGGWYGDDGFSNGPHTVISQGSTGDQTFHAKWTPVTYAVAYDKNASDASGTTASSSHTYDVEKALTDNGFTRTGYDFTGWTALANGGGTSYTDEESVTNLTTTQGATVTLYAKWTPITYAVAYDKNASGASGTTEASNHTYDVEKTISANGFTRTGYAFAGWTAEADGGGTSYTDEESVTNLATTQGATVTLYAKWTIVTYDITYTLYDGTNHADNPASYTVESPEITLKAPTRTGYAFGGWHIDDSFTTAGATIPAGSTEDKNFYAKWTPVTYTVAYDANGGTGTTASSAHTYDVEKALTDNGFARTGYDFTGWAAQADGGGTSYANGQNVVKLATTQGATITLYAKWTINTYTVAYDANGGGGTMISSDHTYEAPKNLTPNGFTRTAHTFTGWNTAPDGTGQNYTDGQSVTNLTTANGATVTLYAKWRMVLPFNITVWANEDDGNILVSNNNVTISKSAAGILYSSFTAEVQGGYSVVQWYLKGAALSGSQGTTQITINAVDYDNGAYILGVQVTKNGIPYSTDIRFTVTN